MSYPIALNRIHGESEHFCECSGTRIVPKMSLDFKKGYAKLKKVGEHNLYEQIQSHKDSTDLNTILQTFNPAPASLSFADAEERIADFTCAPGSYAELFANIRDAENMFAELPVGVRESYGFSVYNFINDYGSASFVDNLKKAYGIQEAAPFDPGSVQPVEPSTDDSNLHIVPDNNAPVQNGDNVIPENNFKPIDVRKNVNGGNE